MSRRARSDASQPSAAAAEEAAEEAAKEAAEEAAQPQRGDPMQESASQAVLHMERGLLSRGTRASARQAALFQDRTAAGDCPGPSAKCPLFCSLCRVALVPNVVQHAKETIQSLGLVHSMTGVCRCSDTTGHAQPACKALLMLVGGWKKDGQHCNICLNRFLNSLACHRSSARLATDVLIAKLSSHRSCCKAKPQQ